MGGLNLVPYMQKLHGANVRITTMMRVSALTRVGNRIAASLWSPYTETQCGERVVDQVVVEAATLPLSDLYIELKDESQNRGEADYEALMSWRPRALRTNPP